MMPRLPTTDSIFMRVYTDDLTRMATLVRAVSFLPSEAATEALKAEFYRVPSSPATWTYLNEVLRAAHPASSALSHKALTTLADDESSAENDSVDSREAAWRLSG
jgi:hypothetical protein